MASPGASLASSARAEDEKDAYLLGRVLAGRLTPAEELQVLARSLPSRVPGSRIPLGEFLRVFSE